MKNFVQWLHEHNKVLPPEKRCGIFGLDIYSMETSMRAVIEYFRRVDPITAISLEDYYECFNKYGMDPQAYGYLTSEVSKLTHHQAGCCSQVQDALEEVASKCKSLAAASTSSADGEGVGGMSIVDQDELFLTKV